MDNNSDLPDGWAMPNDLARKVNEQLNRKCIIPEDERQDALDEMARDIAIIESNLVDWADLVTNLLEQILGEYQRGGKHKECIGM